MRSTEHRVSWCCLGECGVRRIRWNCQEGLSAPNSLREELKYLSPLIRRHLDQFHMLDFAATPQFTAACHSRIFDPIGVVEPRDQISFPTESDHSDGCGSGFTGVAADDRQ